MNYSHYPYNHDADFARPAVPRTRNPSLRGDVLVPLFQSVSIGLATAIAAGGVTALLGEPVVIIGKVAGCAAAFVTAGCTALFTWRHHKSLTRDVDAMRPRVQVLPGESPEPEEPWRVIRPHTPKLTELQVRSIEPEAPKEIRDLYRFLCDMWPTGDISQANCSRHGWTRRYWDSWIGGSRRKHHLGTESGRGLLDRAGVIRKDGNRWVIAAPLNLALSINDDLLRYAKGRASLVKLGKTRPDSTGAPPGAVYPSGIGGTIKRTNGPGCRNTQGREGETNSCQSLSRPP